MRCVGEGDFGWQVLQRIDWSNFLSTIALHYELRQIILDGFFLTISCFLIYSFFYKCFYGIS